jgi:ribose-phosphate pyrophosphokinase
MSGYMLFSGTANPQLAQEVASYLEMPLSQAIINRFSDGEINV